MSGNEIPLKSEHIRHSVQSTAILEPSWQWGERALVSLTCSPNTQKTLLSGSSHKGEAPALGGAHETQDGQRWALPAAESLRLTGESWRLESWKAFAHVSHELDFQEKWFGKDPQAKTQTLGSSWQRDLYDLGSIQAASGPGWASWQDGGCRTGGWQSSLGPGRYFRNQGTPTIPG